MISKVKMRTRRNSSRSKRNIFEPQFCNPESTIELRCSNCIIIINKLEQDKKELQDKFEKSSKQIKLLQQRITRLKDKNNELIDSNTKLKVMNSKNLQREMSQLCEQFEKSENRNAKLNEENEVLRSQVEESEKALNEVKIQDAKRNAKPNEENEVLKSQIEESKKTLDEVKAQEAKRNAELNKENEVLKSQIEESKKTLDEVKAQEAKRNAELSEENEVLKSQIEESETTLDEVKAQLQEAKRNAELNEENEVLKSQIEESKKALDEVKAQEAKRNAELSEENEVLKSQIEESETTLDEVKAQLQEAKRNAELNEENEVLKSQIEESKKALDEVKAQEAKRNAELNEENEVLKSQIEESKKALDEVKAQEAKRNAELNEENELLKSQIEESKKTLDEVKAQEAKRNAELNKENEVLKSQIEESKKPLDGVRMQDAKRLETLKKEWINAKEMLIAEHLAKFNKDVISRMNDYTNRVQSITSTVLQANGVIKKIFHKKLEDEEESYKFTNAFTSAGEGSVLDIAKRYRHLQHNMRASAVRASKEVYKIPAKEFFCSQSLHAYEEAKNVLLEESGNCVYMHLIKLQPCGEVFNDKMLKACMRIVDHIATDEVANKAINRIEEKLKSKDEEKRTETAKDNPLPPDVASYYHTLAELTWQAISRPIPMVYGIEEKVYKKDYHDLRDGESEDEGKNVVYVYPVLYSSNQCPRQIAGIGRVELA